jgi:hypothetical protein
VSSFLLQGLKEVAPGTKVNFKVDDRLQEMIDMAVFADRAIKNDHISMEKITW